MEEATKQLTTKIKQKYDWVEIKREYFESDIVEVKRFLESKFNTYTTHMNKTTAGWTKEKKEHKEKIRVEALKLAEKKLIQQGAQAYNNILMGIFQEVATADQIKRLTIKDKETLWKMISTINNKPTSVSENRNANMNIPTNISEEENENIKKVLKENGLI